MSATLQHTTWPRYALHVTGSQHPRFKAAETEYWGMQTCAKSKGREDVVEAMGGESVEESAKHVHETIALVANTSAAQILKYALQIHLIPPKTSFEELIKLIHQQKRQHDEFHESGISIHAKNLQKIPLLYKRYLMLNNKGSERIVDLIKEVQMRREHTRRHQQYMTLVLRNLLLKLRCTLIEQIRAIYSDEAMQALQKERTMTETKIASLRKQLKASQHDLTEYQSIGPTLRHVISEYQAIAARTKVIERDLAMLSLQ